MNVNKKREMRTRKIKVKANGNKAGIGVEWMGTEGLVRGVMIRRPGRARDGGTGDNGKGVAVLTRNWF